MMNETYASAILSNFSKSHSLSFWHAYIYAMSPRTRSIANHEDYDKLYSSAPASLVEQHSTEFPPNQTEKQEVTHFSQSVSTDKSVVFAWSTTDGSARGGPVGWKFSGWWHWNKPNVMTRNSTRDMYAPHCLH